MNFYGAIFDLDGVLADTARLHSVAWAALLKDIGLSLPADAEHKVKGLERLASLNVLLGEQQNAFSLAQKMEFSERKNRIYLDLIGSLNHSSLLPGAEKILSNLKENDIPVGLASASKNAMQVLVALEVDSYFDFIVDASRVNKSKPDPEIFLAAAMGLNVHPASCVGFEDAPAGLESIIAAGMFAIGIGQTQELFKANKIFPSLEDVLLSGSLKFKKKFISLNI